MTFKLILKSIKGQLSLNIALVFLLSVAIAVTSVASLLFFGVNKLHDQAIKEINGPQVVVYYDETQWSDEELLNHFLNYKEIEKIDIIDTKVIENVKNLPSEVEHFDLLANVYNTESINYNILTSKQTLSLDNNEVYLPLFFKNHFKENDLIFLDNSRVFKVVGFYEDPYLGSSFEIGKTVLMNESTFNDVDSYFYLKVAYLHFNSDLTTKELSNFERDFNHPSIYMFATTNQFKILSMMLPLIFCTILMAIALCLIIVVGLVLIHTIKTTIYSNYREYGIMLTQGFTRNSIIRTSILKNIFINTLSFIIAVFLTFLILPRIGNYVLYNTGMLWKSNFNLQILLVIFISFNILLSIISYISLRSIKRISIIRAISNKGPDYSFNSRINIKITKLSRLPINIAFSVKKLLANIRNYLSLLILSVVLTLALVIVTTTLISINEDDFVYNVLGLPNSDIYLSTQSGNANSERYLKEINEKFEIESYYATQITSFTINDVNIVGIAYNSFDNVNKGNIVHDRFPQKSNEVAITPLVSDKLNIYVSDTVTIKTNDTIETYIVVGIIQSVAQAGNTIIIQDNDLIYTDQNLTYNIIFKDSTKIDDARDYIIDKYHNDFPVSRESMFSIGDMIIITRIFFIISLVAYFVTVLFVSIISYMLVKMSITKETRDIGILKSSGFTNKQIRVQFITRLKILTVIGATLGLIIGKLYGIKLITPIFSAVGIAKIEESFYWYTYLIPFTIMIFINLLFSFIATRRIKSIEIKDLMSE